MKIKFTIIYHNIVRLLSVSWILFCVSFFVFFEFFKLEKFRIYLNAFWILVYWIRHKFCDEIGMANYLWRIHTFLLSFISFDETSLTALCVRSHYTKIESFFSYFISLLYQTNSIGIPFQIVVRFNQLFINPINKLE